MRQTGNAAVQLPRASASASASNAPGQRARADGGHLMGDNQSRQPNMPLSDNRLPLDSDDRGASIPDEITPPEAEEQPTLATAPMLAVTVRPELRPQAERILAALQAIQQVLITWRVQSQRKQREAALDVSELLTTVQAISGDPDTRPADGNRMTHTSVHRIETNLRFLGSMPLRVLLGLMAEYRHSMADLVAMVEQATGARPRATIDDRLMYNFHRLPSDTQEQVAVMVQALANTLAPVARGEGGDPDAPLTVEDALSDTLRQIDDLTQQ